MLQMTFQSRILFAGKWREPGEVISSSDLAAMLEENPETRRSQTTLTAIHALKNRGLAILQDDSDVAAAERNAAVHERVEHVHARMTALEEQNQSLHEKLDGLIQSLGGDPDAPAKRKKSN